MTDPLHQNLTSALSELADKFKDDQESLHFAVSIVFASILRKHALPCVIVGGQSAAYWMHLPGSIDVDFVSPKTNEIALALECCGFSRSADYAFRYNHPVANVMIELVGEQINIAGIKSPVVVSISPDDVGDEHVRSLMQGPAEVIDPVLVFMNYVDASDSDSVWYSYENEGALAIERAQALFVLYKDYILDGLRKQNETAPFPTRLSKVLQEKFAITIG